MREHVQRRAPAVSRVTCLLRTLSAGLVLSSALSATGCGSDATGDCEKLADAYARAWQRCMRGTYDSAKKIWDDALMCGKASSSNGGKVDACVSALDALDCTAVTNGTSPAACSDSVSQ